MPAVVPCPTQQDLPFNDPYRERLDAGNRLRVLFEPEQRNTTFRAPIVAISKHPEMRYVVKADGTKRFESAAPPTDPDNLQATFIPALAFHQELEVVVENLSSATTRNVIVQPIGWEEVNNGA